MQTAYAKLFLKDIARLRPAAVCMRVWHVGQAAGGTGVSQG